MSGTALAIILDSVVFVAFPVTFYLGILMLLTAIVTAIVVDLIADYRKYC